MCRQTSLLIAAGESNLIVNIKKGQFAHSSTMKHANLKVQSNGNNKITLCERGNSFGYGLVVDFTNLVNMRENKDALIIFDSTHSVQIPNCDSFTHGNRAMIPTLARCAVATGIHGLFLEVHDDPINKARCDGTNQLILKDFEPLLTELINISNASNGLSK